MMKLLICLIFLTVSNLSFSQEKEAISGQVDKDKLPVPNEKNQLFYLQRDPDANTIVYVLNMEGETLNKSNPVLAHWIRYAEKGQIEKLTFVQRRLAYGINHKEIEPGVYELHIQSYKALKIILSPNLKTGKYQALVKVENSEIILDRIFVRISGGSIFRPNIEYIEVSGRRIDNGKKVHYQFGL
jgi:hypothetical protein